ncbi:hypothetical protein [Salmonella phage SSBI34]|nr:hypothetical protein [Salmonella phage SSBI34]
MIKYIIQGYEYSFAPDITIFDLTDEWDLEAIAQQAAANYRDYHDGWESWKEGDVDCELFDEDNKLIYSCKISLCWEPSFEIWGGNKK